MELFQTTQSGGYNELCGRVTDERTAKERVNKGGCGRRLQWDGAEWL